jgi:hypothetical protein
MSWDVLVVDFGGRLNRGMRTDLVGDSRPGFLEAFDVCLDDGNAFFLHVAGEHLTLLVGFVELV